MTNTEACTDHGSTCKSYNRPLYTLNISFYIPIDQTMRSFSPSHMHLRRPSETSINSQESFLLISPPQRHIVLPHFTHKRNPLPSSSSQPTPPPAKPAVQSNDPTPPPRYRLAGLDGLPPEILAINIPCYLAEHGLYENLRSRRPFSIFTPRRKKETPLPSVEPPRPSDIIDYLRQIPHIASKPLIMPLHDFHQAIQQSSLVGMGQITDLRYYHSRFASPGSIRNFVAVCHFPSSRSSLTSSTSTIEKQSTLYIILRFPIDITEMLEEAMMAFANKDNLNRYRRDVALYLMPPGEEPGELERDAIGLRRSTLYSGLYLKECVGMMDTVVGRIPRSYLGQGGSRTAAKAVYYAQAVPLLAPFLAPSLQSTQERRSDLPTPPR